MVRRVLPGETGPTGGPAMTDLLGVMESWQSGTTTIRAESGAVTAIRIGDIVSGKPVPPRPSVRHRIHPEDAERRAVAGWPPLTSRPLGEWLLRASAGYSSRANSVLAVGHPGTGIAAALDEVVSFYAAESLPPLAQVVVGSDVLTALESAGWVPARPHEDDTEFRLASVARALREVRRVAPADLGSVETVPTAGPDWLADDEHARAHGEAALRVLEGPPHVGFTAIRSAPGGEVIAKGRAACGDRAGDDWVGVTNVWVSSAHRRKGLALTVMGALLEWGAERGATTAYLQTRADNPGALALYDRLGFATHHTYRYLTAPPDVTGSR